MPEFNSIVSEEIFGSPTINQIPLEQPKSQPLNYQVPQSSVNFDRYAHKSTSSSNPLGDFLTKFNSAPVDLAQQIRPIGFNAESVGLKKYINSPNFKELGIELDDSNEERYGLNQSLGDVLSNGFTGARKLAAVGFVDTWKGFGRIIDAISSRDWSKIHGDAASMLELDNEIKDIMDEYPIYATKQGTDTFWNRETAGNFLQQSGFAVGAGLSMASEHLLTKAIEAGLVASGVGAPAAVAIEGAVDAQTVANVGRFARIMNRSKEFFDAAKNFKALKKIGDLWKEDKLVTTFIEGLGKKLPGVDMAVDMNQVWRAGKTAGITGGEIAWDLTKVGAGGIKRLLSESNFAFSEARMEAAGTYSDLYSKLQADYLNTYGVQASEEQLKKMSAVSMEAADKNFNFNSALLAISNRIAFDNVFKNSKSTQNILAKYGLDGAIENRLTVKGVLKGTEIEATQLYKKGNLGTIGQLGKVAEDFGTKKALQVGAGSILKNITKFETTEGIQELLQEGSNVYFQDYYSKAYQASINPDYKPDLKSSLDKAIDSQVNMQGLKTFMSGALTGLILHGPTVLGGKALKYGNEKIVDYNKIKNLSAEERIKYQENKLAAKDEDEKHYNVFNAYAKDPSSFFSEAVKNLNLQKEGTTVLDEAAKLGDKFSYENLRTDTLHGFIAASIRNNTHEAFLDTLKAYGDKFTKEEFEKAFVGIEYSSENKKSATDYTSKIIGSVESYIKTWNKLQDRYGNRANPNRFKFGSKEWFKESIRKKTLNDVIELLSGNESKAVDALDRATSIFQRVSGNKALGTSLNSAFQILGSETNLENEIDTLSAEIKLSKSQLSAEGLSAEDKKKIQEQLEIKETQLEHLKNWNLHDWNLTKVELVKEADVNKSLAAFKGYLQSKNKQAGKNIVVNNKDVDDHFLDLTDYIKLNDKSKQYVDAINFLADEKNFTALHDRMTNGARNAYFELLGQAGIEHIKNNSELNESFILSIHDTHSVYDKDGNLIGVYDTLEDATAAKEQFDTEEEVPEEEIEDEEIEDETETEQKKEGDKKEPVQKKKTKKNKPEETEETLEDQTDLVEEQGTFDPEMIYVNNHFGIVPKKINYKIKYADNGQIAYATWSFVGSKEAPNVEKSVNTIADLENILRLKSLMDYLTKVQKIYKVDIKDTEVESYGKPGGRSYKEYKYTGIIPSIFTKTEELPFFYDLLTEDQKENFNEGLYTEDNNDLEGLNKPDFDLIKVSIKADISEILNSIRAEIAKQTAAIKEVRTVDQKFITSATNVVKMFTMKDETMGNMKEVVFSMSKDEIKNKMTGTIEKMKPGEPQVVFDKTRNKVRLKVYRQSPVVASTILVNDKPIGYPTHPDVYIFEIDGVKKTSNELTKKEFYLFAQDTVSYEEYMSNYNTSMAVYTAFAELLGDKKSVKVSNEELQKIFDITPIFGNYTFSKAKTALSEFEKNGIKLLGVVDKNNVAEAIVPGKNLTEVTDNRSEINKHITSLEVDPATGAIKRFSNQGRYIAVFTLPNGHPAFVEVTSANLDEDGLDTVYSELASRLQKTFKENVLLESDGKISEVKNKNFNRGFDTFTEDSGRTPFYIAIPQNPQKPDALSYNVTITVTANGSLVVQFVNTQSKDVEYHKAYIEVKYDEKGNPDIENFTDMLAKINTEIVNYNSETKEAELPILKPEYFKESIPKAAKFSDMAKQVTNVTEDIFQNTHIIFTQSSTATPDVDASSKKTGKNTGKKEEVIITPVSTDAKADIERRRQEALLGGFKIEDTRTSKNGSKPQTRLKINSDGTKITFEGFYEDKPDTGLNPAFPRMTLEEFRKSEFYKNLKPESKELLEEMISDNKDSVTGIALNEIRISKSEGDFIGKGNSGITLTILAKNGNVNDIALASNTSEINAKYDAELAALESGKEEPVKKKRGGLGLSGLKVDVNAARRQAAAENTADEDKASGKVATNSQNKTVQEIQDQYSIDKDKLEEKFQKDRDIVEYDKELTKLEKQFNKDMEPFISKRRINKTKISDTEDFTDASVEDIDKFKSWMKKVLSNIDVDADTLAENLANNKVIVGKFIAYVKMTSNGPVISGSIQTSAEAAFKYHEAFHAVFTLFLNDEQIDKLLSLARYQVVNKLKTEGKNLSEEVEKMRSTHPMYAEMTKEQLTERYLEEHLADEFDKFKMNQSTPGLLAKIRELFAKLLDFINSLLGRQSELKTFYKSIDKGKFNNVNVQSNKFTRELALVNNPVIEKFKIKYGYKQIETLTGEIIMTPKYVNESDTQRIVGSVVNSFIHRVENMPEYNKARVLDGILLDMMKLYQIGPKYATLSIDKINRLRMFKDIFNSNDAKEDIKKNVNVFLELMGYTQDLEDDMEYENAIEDEGDRATTEKFGEKFAQGGFKSFSKYARQYIQSTTYEKQDEFGNQFLDEETQEPLAFGVNSGVIYNGMVKLMSGVTTEEKFIQRLLHFKNAASEQTVAFINKFLEDTGISEESEFQPIKNKRLFNAIYKPFTLFNVSYRSYLIDPKTGKSKSIRANMRDAASNQYNQWQNDFNNNYQDNWSKTKQDRVLELMTSINDGLKGEFEISDEEFAEKAKQLKELERLSGIKIVFEYYKYSALSTLRENFKKQASPLTKEQIDFVKSFDGIPVLLSEDISEIMKTIAKKESPFITFDDVQVDTTPAGSDEDDNFDSDADEPEEDVSEEQKADEAVKYEKQMNKGNRSRLMRIAEGNSLFDETVLSSSWLNSEFETVSSHQLPNFHLTYLEDIIKNPIALERLITEDPYLMDSYIGQQILNNGEFRQALNRLRIDRIDGITARRLTQLEDGTILANSKLQVNKRDGITYGKFNDREFLLTNILMYLEDQETMRKAGGEEIVSTRHLIRVIESKSTGDTINMPVISTVIGKGNKVKLSEEASKIWLQEFMAEFNRINRVWADRNNPEKDILDNYNDFDNPKSQLRGVKFRTFEDILGPKKSEEYRNLAMSDNPTLNARQKEEIVNLVQDYLLGDPKTDNPGLIDEYIYMLDDAGIIKVTDKGINNVMLPAEIFGNKMKNPTDRMNKGYLGTDFRANIAQFFINDYLNTISINKLYYGDQSMSLVDFVDAVKRAAGAIGSGNNMATSLIEENLGITHSHQNSHVVTHVDPVYKGQYSKSEKQKWADAQTWSTVKTARYNSFGLGRLDKYKAEIFDKLERGVPLTAEEVFGINGTIENNAQLKVEKLVYFDGRKYIKTSVFFLTKELTSQLKLSAKRRIDALLAKAAESEITEKDYLEQAYAIQRNNNNWIARPGREILHNKRVEMEKFQDENATTVYSIPVSASKMTKKNVSQSLEDFNISQNQAYKIDNRYMRLQLENTTNKKGGINDSTQMQNIIDAEQNPNAKVIFKGKEGVKIKDVIKEFQNAIAQKAKLSYLLARNNIFSFEDIVNEYEISVKAGEITAKLAKFQKKALENLKKTGASQQLLEFFELDKDSETGEETPAYDLNSPYTRKKYEQLFLSYFRRDILQQRTPGQALTLTSDWGAEPLKRAKRIVDGKVVEWEVVRVDQQEASDKEYRPMSDKESLKNIVNYDDFEFFHKNIDEVTEVGQLFVDRLRHNIPVYDESENIIGYKTEFMMPHHFRETMEIGAQSELPKAILDYFAARIPGQDKHSACSLDLVDFLPAHYGSMGMFAREMAEISGADNDVDKGYTQFTDFYVKRNKEGEAEFVKYGTATSDVDRFVEFFLWNIANNKILGSEIRDIKEKDEDYAKVKTLLDKLYIAKEHILKYKKSSVEYLEELNQIDTAISFLSKVDTLDEPADDLSNDYLLNEYNRVKGHAAEFIKEKILHLDGLISDISAEIITSKTNIAVVKKRINQVKREKILLERIIQMEAMENLHLPTDVETFLDFEYDMDGEVNIGALNNTILEAKRALLSNEYMQEDSKAFEVADQGVLEDLEKDSDIAPYLNPDSTIDNDNQVGKTLSQLNNKEGSRNIGSVVNGQMANTFLMKNTVRFRRKDPEKANQVYILKIDDTEFDSYEHERKAVITDDNEVIPKFNSKSTRRIMNAGSGYVSAMTDNAKDRRSAKFGLNINAAGIAMDLNGRGVPDKLIAALMLNKTVQKYYNAVKKEKYAITKSEKRISKKKIAAEMMEKLIKKAGGEKAEIKPLTTTMLLDGLSNPTAETNLSIFHHFLNIEKQSEAFSTLSQVLKLTKGPTADMNDWDDLVEKAHDHLGIGMTEEQFQKSDIPFDVRKLVLESSPIISTYWKINEQIHNEIGKTVLISRSKLFKTTKNALLEQLDVQYSLLDKVEGKLENNLIMYFALRAYVKTLRTYDDELLTLLDNNLVYGTHKGSENITDIIKEARRNNPKNYLINKYLRLVPTTVMQGGVEIFNKDNKKKVHILEPSTYGLIDPHMLSKIQDSFMDLYENDRKAALAIFAYSIVKDATLFSPNGIMHIFPSFMFKELMGDVMFNVGTIFKNDNLEEYLSQGKKSRDFSDMFGGTFKQVVADFMEGYLKHVENKYHIKTYSISMPEKGAAPLPVRFTVDETGKIDRKQVVIDIFTSVKPSKIKYKKKKAQDNPEDDEESNIEEASSSKYKLDKKALEQLKNNIKALKDSNYRIFTTSDDNGNIGLQLPYSFKVKTRKGFDVYVLQNISKISDQEKMQNVSLADVLTDKFNIVAPSAIYKLVETEGAYGVTPIGNVFGDVPLYNEINNPELLIEEKKRLEETPTEKVEEDEEESDLEISSPDKPLKRPSNEEEEDEEPVAQKRDVAFLKSKGISVSLKGGEYVYKKNGKEYKFDGSPRELADFFDEDGSFNEKITGKKVVNKKEIKSGVKKFYDPAYAPGGTKGKKTGYIPKVNKLERIEDEDITQKMVDKILEEETQPITHYDGKKFVKFIGTKFNQYGTYKTKIEGQSAISLIKSGIKTEVNVGFKDTLRDINELFVMEDIEKESPTFGEQILLRAVTPPYKSNKASFNKNQGWDSSVWEGRKGMINKYNELSFRFEYVGDIVDDQLVLPEEKPETPGIKKVATVSKTKEAKETKKETPTKLPQSAFKNDTFVPKAGSIQETITNRLEDVMSESAKKAGYLEKEQYKSKRATQYIGEGAVNKKGEDSSTETFRKLYDEYDIANTGDYTSDDMIWVSTNGNRAGRIKSVVDGELQGEYKNITAAIKARASFIMDTAEHIASNTYNVGEKELAEYLSKKGYVREDKTGIWTPKPKAEKSEEVAPVKKFSLGLNRLNVDINALRQQAAKENTDIDDKTNKFAPGTQEAADKIDCSKKK